ncbi:MAG: class I SAM-dependent methyltransferase [Deltaproteobacteria bacterium]|nr:class I SAM-dependent methyltransferase [Deltaproteobacteria bacterium]
MGIRAFVKPRLQDLLMRQMNPLRPEALEPAHGEVLEVGFGTALNLEHYPPGVTAVTGLDPMEVGAVATVSERIREAAFPVERKTLRADGELPFDAGRFDCIVTTWTLCSIPDAAAALAEMHRVLKPGGLYCFIEHGRADAASTARWQDRINPLWRRVCDGCNINRKIDRLVESAGFELANLDRFRAKGPGIVAQMYRGIATRT